jgi:hypothetical protein
MISLNNDQISGLLHHVRNKGEEKVGDMARQLGVSELQLKEYWQANRCRWPDVLISAEAVDRKKVASGAWTRNEDAVIESRVYAQGKHTNWGEIARQLGRTISQVKQRYHEELSRKTRIWTPQDDSDLMLIQREIGSRWEQIAMQMNRTIIDVEMRYRFLNTQPGKDLIERGNISSDCDVDQELEGEETADDATAAEKHL